ncbi:hypothetical protein E4U53_004947 [Claviceps sorghi]|nr:hypothetical protein E4U53_004947 [Claviceps sorghi]
MSMFIKSGLPVASGSAGVHSAHSAHKRPEPQSDAGTVPGQAKDALGGKNVDSLLLVRGPASSIVDAKARLPAFRAPRVVVLAPVYAFEAQPKRPGPSDDATIFQNGPHPPSPLPPSSAMQSPHREVELCRRCAQGLFRSRSRALQKRSLCCLPALRRPADGGRRHDGVHRAGVNAGAMSRRLEDATEEALVSGGASGRRAVHEAGFSEELRERLLGRIADSARSLPGSAPQQEASRRAATGEAPWTGTENTADAVLRMLTDARKPLRSEHGARAPRRGASACQSPGQRAVGARDRASMYVGMDRKAGKGLSVDERAETKAELRERFRPAGGAVPVSISGIAALADRRIEEAMARGQFKDLPRGRELRRDPAADNPFVDTTEYILNRMIRRQEIVPPWIEKQQELNRAARLFRQRLRNDWKRHAVRVIASRGGSLGEQLSLVRHGRVGREDHAGAGADADDRRPAETSPLAAFRDHEWERAERAYMELAVANLNSITRSYNLMAPELARKPYFSLDRELRACFADAAPLIAEEIKARALGRPTTTTPAAGGVASQDAARTFIGRFLRGRDSVKVHLEAEGKAYGLKEWWRDIWSSK